MLSSLFSVYSFAQGTPGSKTTEELQTSFHIQTGSEEPGLYRSGIKGENSTRVYAATYEVPVESVVGDKGRLYLLTLDHLLAKSVVLYSEDQGDSWKDLATIDRMMNVLEINDDNELIAYDRSDPENPEVLLTTHQLGLTDAERSLRIYPNPGDTYIKIAFEGYELNASDIQLFSGIGKLMSVKVDKAGNEYHMDISKLDAGIYFLNLKMKDQMITRSIIIE